MQVILPVFNEAKIIDKVLDEAYAFHCTHPHFSFIFVDDGSSDNSANVIELKIINWQGFQLLRLKKNAGKAKAIAAAIHICQANNVAFMDSDQAYGFEHLLKLQDCLQNNDMVIGNRNLASFHQRNKSRHITGEAFNRLVRFILKLPYTDTQAGIKGFKTEIAKALFSKQKITNFAFDAELVFIARQKAYRIGEIAAMVNEAHGSKASSLKILSDSPKMFFSLFKILFYKYIGSYK